MASTAALQIILKARDEASSVLKGAGSAVSGLGGALRVAGGIAIGGASAVGAAVAGVGVAALLLAKNAAPVVDLSKAFEGIAGTTERGVDGMMAALKEGSAGMVSQRDLMLSFNNAAQLVSTDFAEQLPDAMQYLTKVSAATGDSVGYLMDSLVTGVGRLSVPILDNLKIQVSQAEATARATEMFGLQADELSKTQLQTGMMNVVMEKLAANTANMPDVTEGAAAGLARMGAMVQDTKDRIGGALVPALGTMLTVIADLVDRVLPPFIDFFETKIAPAIETVVGVFGTFVSGLIAGQTPIEALKAALTGVVPPETIAAITNMTTKVSEFIAKANEVLAPIFAWIGKNVELQDILIALGVVVAAVIIPALASVIAAAAPVIAVFLLVIATVALVRAAWESNFLGIQQITATVWEAIQAYVSWGINNIKTVIAAVMATITALWDAHGATILAAANMVWTAIQTAIATATSIIKSVIAAVTAAIHGDWYTFGAKMREVVDTMWAAIKNAFNAAKENLLSVLRNLVSNARSAFTNIDWGGVGRAVINGIINGVRGGVGALRNAVTNAARAALDAAKGFLGIRSPSKAAELGIGAPFDEGMERGILKGIPGIARAAREAGGALLSGAQGSSLGSARGTLTTAPGSGLGATGGGLVIHNHFGPGSVRSDEDIEKIARRMQELLQVRGLREFGV